MHDFSELTMASFSTKVHILSSDDLIEKLMAITFFIKISGIVTLF